MFGYRSSNACRLNVGQPSKLASCANMFLVPRICYTRFMNASLTMVENSTCMNATMGRREHTKHSNTSSSNIETPEVTLVYDLTIFVHCSWCGELSLACLKNQLPNQMGMTPQYFLCPFANRVLCLFEWLGELFVSYTYTEGTVVVASRTPLGTYTNSRKSFARLGRADSS